MVAKAAAEGVKVIRIHALLDGRDVPETSALDYVDPFEEFLAGIREGGCDAKIASGGELSRIMLSIKNVLADNDNVDTLIFDEVDTGISGSAAQKVGQKLKQVSKGRQIICVTHLAQVAAYADNHLLISKSTEGGKTFTSVESLGKEGRVNELARIMGGTMTDALRKSAEELLELSK